jgi:putative hemolysin
MVRACRDKGNKAQGTTASTGVSVLNCNSWEAEDMSEKEFFSG